MFRDVLPPAVCVLQEAVVPQAGLPRDGRVRLRLDRHLPTIRKKTRRKQVRASESKPLPLSLPASMGTSSSAERLGLLPEYLPVLTTRAAGGRFAKVRSNLQRHSVENGRHESALWAVGEGFEKPYTDPTGYVTPH